MPRRVNQRKTALITATDHIRYVVGDIWPIYDLTGSALRTSQALMRCMEVLEDARRKTTWDDYSLAFQNNIAVDRQMFTECKERLQHRRNGTQIIGETMTDCLHKHLVVGIGVGSGQELTVAKIGDTTVLILSKTSTNRRCGQSRVFTKFFGCS